MCNNVETCGAVLQMGDDMGDNSCTFRCNRTKGHTGKHCETGKLHGKYKYRLTFEDDMWAEERLYFFWRDDIDTFTRICAINDLRFRTEHECSDLLSVGVFMTGHDFARYKILEEADRMEGGKND